MLHENCTYRIAKYFPLFPAPPAGGRIICWSEQYQGVGGGHVTGTALSEIHAMNQVTRAQFLRGDWQKPPVSPSADAVAHISPACVAYRSVLCRSCADTCAPSAIVFDATAGNVAHPTIDQDRCNGCGDCRTSCPVQAIVLVEREFEGESN